MKFKTLAIGAAAFLVASCATQKMNLKYPDTKKGDHTDTYFGTTVSDPYRWLEDDRAEETKDWVQREVKFTNDYLAQIPFRPSELDSITTSAQRLLGIANGLVERLNLVFDDQNRARFTRILENTEGATGQMHRLIKQLEPGIKKLPELANDASSVLNHTDQLIIGLNQITTRLNQQGGPIDNLSQTAAELPNTLHKLNGVAEGFTRNSRNVDRVLLQLEEQPGSLLFGRSPPPPGPGEDGFISPGNN